ncbi:hypothetical protein RN001_007230 [Aquatica leii]|uniref:Uncharacterized protein n=1 Tax=Aquatica leii TaxID=1421715 RepID=A0AAN7P8F4_9COLE|nr:hypothetical protein RN001_007230 [Aquatica leii]
MKRHKESGDFYRKQKKGALLKYLELAAQRGVTEHDIETSVTTSEKCAPLQGEDTGDSTATQAKDEYADESISDIGTWPILIPDNLRTLLLARGYKTVQHLDCKFAEVNRPGSKDSTKGPKGVTRKLNRDWFFRTLPNGKKVLRTWMTYSLSKESFGFNTIDGFNQWWKLNPKVLEHESSTAHNENFNMWKCLERRLQAVDNRDVMVNDVLSYAKTTCEDLGIDIAPRCIRKTKKIKLQMLV